MKKTYWHPHPVSTGTRAHVYAHTRKSKFKIVGNSSAEPVEGVCPACALETPFWPTLEKGEVSVKSFSFMGVRRVHLEKLRVKDELYRQSIPKAKVSKSKAFAYQQHKNLTSSLRQWVSVKTWTKILYVTVFRLSIRYMWKKKLKVFWVKFEFNQSGTQINPISY